MSGDRLGAGLPLPGDLWALQAGGLSSSRQEPVSLLRGDLGRMTTAVLAAVVAEREAQPEVPGRR